ncbi:MAG: ComEC/Rec2 family competence protein [Bifidobacteriaceae bacterium]|jgi:competence protein ComEC|nr:ComEC/Rec2 family competence protein [Bifidobacteriaceae bacterium]
MNRTTDLRLALPVACAWAAAAVALGWPRPVAAGVGLAALAGGGAVLGLRAGGNRRRADVRAFAGLALAVAGVVVGAVGVQGMAWDQTGLGQAAQAGGRVELVLRMDQPAKVRDSPWGGAQTVTAMGAAWVAGAEDGPGVPAVAYFEGEAPPAGSVLTFRARLATGELADPQRVVAHAIGPVTARRPGGWRGVVYGLRAGLTGRANPLLEGIALGDTGRIGQGLDADLKTTSLTHITAVSGAHVAIVLGAVLGLAALVGCPSWVKAGLGAATLIGFAALIGPGPSVWRAVAMGLAALAGVAFGKTRLALGALAAAVLLVLLADPWLARSYGLVLSALATAGLIVLAPPLALAATRRWPRLPHALVEAAALTASAQLLCAPVIAIFAGQISLSALPANLLAAPAVPVATIGAMASLLAGPWWAAGANVAAAVGNLASTYIAAVARWVATWPLAAIAWPAGFGGFALAAAATAALAAVWWWLRRRGRRWRMVAAGLAVAAAIVAGPARGTLIKAIGRGPPAEWVAAVCDVGQGTAVAVRSGPEAAVLIDAGPERGGVDKCLERLGVKRLDVVVLTHFHADHVGGLEEALAGRTVGDLVYGTPCGLDPTRSLALAERAGATARRVEEGQPLSGQAGSAALVVYPSSLAGLCPDAAQGGEDSAANDAGLAVLARVDSVTVWALGDLEGAGQTALLRSLGRTAVPGAGGLVVVAHHGSADQSEALATALAPKVAVMSAGLDNPYGHPNPKALDLYGRIGEVRRTDRDGTVVVTAADLAPPA